MTKSAAATGERARTRFLPYDPGPLPTRPAPQRGDVIELALDGVPPAKVHGSSMRNPTHPRYAAFADLRRAAISAMNGRAWYLGPVGLEVEVWVSERESKRSLLEYIGGIMDTLDGGHGLHFTYRPVVYEDDCQIEISKMRLREGADHEHYHVRAT